MIVKYKLSDLAKDLNVDSKEIIALIHLRGGRNVKGLDLDIRRGKNIGKECADVLNGVRREENDALRDVFHIARSRGLIADVKFEVWLFSLLGLSCFYHSNQLTMVHTLDSHLADEAWQLELTKSVQKLFAGN